ncbi:alpha-ketoglutarate-dependent dioxygenase AlkB family protein [Gaetbulibacter aestuarii]|uniref:Alpha-ketoglutarate-dependent dioxygenase AlkB n=1 Tax=Gaetbulibacter aestuarii TaxID=1502358 RepID=A0ABW7MYK3_9FLAO
MCLKESHELNMPDAQVVYYPQFFNKDRADSLLANLLNTTPWQQDTITVFGKTYLQPRLTAFFANNNKVYKYSNITMQPHNFQGDLLEIKKEVENVVGTEFTSCLANLYRDGQDSNGWHADDEKSLGKNPIIASISLGSERIFQFKHKTHKNLREKLVLEHGSLLVMRGKTQHNWLHQIPKTRKPVAKRINLTFRIIQ